MIGPNSAPLPVRIVAVGDELLEGWTADTNSRRIQRALGAHAVQVRLGQVVPDEAAAVAAALERTEAGDLVFVTGGLGSTPDDLTREAVAAWAQVELAEDPALRAALEERWRRRGIGTAPGALRQSQVPAGLTPLANPVGSAPGLAGELRGRTLVLLPGVPEELEGLLPVVLAWLAEHGLLPAARPQRLWRTAQIAELALVRRCQEAMAAHPDLLWSWWLTDWGVDVRAAAAVAAGEPELAAAARLIDEEFGRLVYTCADETLPEVILRRLAAAGRTVAVAESCTAGLLAGRLTDPAGSSAVFRGGIVTYADDVKRSLLGVAAADLHEHGAVSEPVVRAMAAGARERLGSDYALAVSGISGPGGGTPQKPVGTTWVAVATPAAVFARGYRFPGDRARNRLLTVAAAADTLRRVLEFGDGRSPWHPDDTWGRPR